MLRGFLHIRAGAEKTYLIRNQPDMIGDKPAIKMNIDSADKVPIECR